MTNVSVGSQTSITPPISTKNAISSKSPSHGWIAAAVLIPVIFIVALLAVVFWIRRRKKVASRVKTVEAKLLETHELELHGDSRVVPHELQGDRGPGRDYELPALEPVGSELGLGKHDLYNEGYHD